MTSLIRALAILLTLVTLGCGSRGLAGPPDGGGKDVADDGVTAGDVGSERLDADAALLLGCTVAPPQVGIACSGSFTCGYVSQCVCNVCCSSGYGCKDGKIAYLGFNDGCTQPGVCAADAATDRAGDAATDGAADAVADGATDAGIDRETDAGQAVCTPGADQTCNDNPVISSIRGHCTAAGTCVCGNDAAPTPASGRCL